MRGALREMMLMHTSGIAELPGKVAQAKALLKFLAESCSEDTPYGNYLRRELEMLQKADDSYIAHEFLEEENTAFYFGDFLKEAAKHELGYLGDAEVSSMIADNLPPQAAQTLKSLNLNLLATEQYMDFVRNRTFRSTLLCHAARQLNRSVEPARLETLQVGTFISLKDRAQDGKPATFTNAAGLQLSVQEPATALVFEKVAALGRDFVPVPRFIDGVLAESGDKIPGKDAAAKRDFVAHVLLQGYFRRMLDFIAGPLSRRAAVSENPETLPLARWQVNNHHRISSHRLEMHNADPFIGKFIAVCDGTRDRAAIIDALTESLAKKEFQLNENNQPVTDEKRGRFIVEQLYDGALQNLRQLGLLVPQANGNGDHA